MSDAAPSDLLAWIIASGAAATAVYGIWRYVIRPVARAVTLIVRIGGDFLGHDERPGVARVPGVMERLAGIDRQIKVNGTGLPLGDAVARTLKDTDVLRQRADTNAAGIAELKVGQGDARVAAEKAAELAEKAAGLAAEVHEELHDWIEEGSIREQTYIAALSELGIDLDPQPHRDPHARTREDDQ